MKALREVIEKYRLASERWTRDDSLRPTLADAAEAELKELQGALLNEKLHWLDKVRALERQLDERDRQLAAARGEVSFKDTMLAERDRADAELLETIKAPVARSNRVSMNADLRAAAERWAAAKGGGK